MLRGLEPYWGWVVGWSDDRPGQGADSLSEEPYPQRFTLDLDAVIEDVVRQLIEDGIWDPDEGMPTSGHRCPPHDWVAIGGLAHPQGIACRWCDDFYEIPELD